jgi:hypothetical protein
MAISHTNAAMCAMPTTVTTKRLHRITAAAILLLAVRVAHAADPCPVLQRSPVSANVATRIATVACAENLLWYRPFITADGRMASATVTEGESGRLADATTPAWQRVALYWSDSGLMPRMASSPGALDCGYAIGPMTSSPACRAFVIDHPWSAVFVSYVMRKAGVPGFHASPSHFDYVRDAWLYPDASPFLFLDTAVATPAVGDLLCYVRMAGQVYGYAGLIAAIDGHRGSLNMHCDIVAGVDAGKAYLIGGNVQQGVTMRLLHVNRTGHFWGLPRRSAIDPACSPDSEASCDFNRQDWAVLLKLKAPAVLAQLPHAAPAPALPPTEPTRTSCCVYCVLGADPPVPRCVTPTGG